AVLNNKYQCDLVIVDDAGIICHLSEAPNRIVISTGQIVRAAVISHVVAEKFSKSNAARPNPNHLDDLHPDKIRDLNIHIVDPHWFDDMEPKGSRQKIVKRRPPPGMAPAFGDVSDAEELWSWAERQLSAPPLGVAADCYEAVSL